MTETTYQRKHLEHIKILKESPIVTLEKLLVKHPFIQPIAREMAKLGVLYHGMNVATVYEGTIASIVSGGLINGEANVKNISIPWLIGGIGGALFHDIGKLGIESKGMISSLNKIEMNSIMIVDPKNLSDSRSPELREEQHNHSAIGGHILINLMKMGFFPKEEQNLIKLWVDAAFGHHENNKNGFRDGYPRQNNGNRNNIPAELFVIKLVQLSDAAVAMRESRTYRKDPINIIGIANELETYLSDSELKFIWQVVDSNSKPNYMDLQKLRMSLVSHVLRATFDIDEYIRDIDLTSQVSWLKVGNEGDYNPISSRVDNDDLAKIECPILDAVIDHVWKSQRERLIKSIGNGVKNGFNHASRNN